MICFEDINLLLHPLSLKKLKNMKLNNFYIVITCGEAANT